MITNQTSLQNFEADHLRYLAAKYSPQLSDKQKALLDNAFKYIFDDSLNLDTLSPQDGSRLANIQAPDGIDASVVQEAACRQFCMITGLRFVDRNQPSSQPPRPNDFSFKRIDAGEYGDDLPMALDTLEASCPGINSIAMTNLDKVDHYTSGAFIFDANRHPVLNTCLHTPLDNPSVLHEDNQARCREIKLENDPEGVERYREMNNGLALQYVKNPTPEICLAAVQQNPDVEQKLSQYNTALLGQARILLRLAKLTQLQEISTTLHGMPQQAASRRNRGINI